MSNILEDIPEAVQIYEYLNPHFPKEESTKFVGGCVRDSISGFATEDIDLATKLLPEKVIEILNHKNIKTYNHAIKYGVVAAKVNNLKFEITTLREDLISDGRYAKVVFTKDWNTDAKRRDFTINAIYYGMNQNKKKDSLFDPYNGKIDLLNGKINFIKESNISIKEDFVRSLRYFRFFLKYSKFQHDPIVLNSIFNNKENIRNISKNRMKTEMKKIVLTGNYKKLLSSENIKNFFYFIFPKSYKFLHLEVEEAIHFIDY